MLGGKFSYERIREIHDSPKEIIENVISENVHWKSFGGKPSLLTDDPVDVAGWLESTADHQVFILAANVTRCMTCLNAKQVQIYGKFDTEPQEKPEDGTENVLIHTSRKTVRLGATKGIHFDGALADEDVVELQDERYISSVLKCVASEAGPHVECMIRRADTLNEPHVHAFLPSNAVNGISEQSGFELAAMNHYIKSSRLNILYAAQETRDIALRENTHTCMTGRNRDLGNIVFDPKFTKATDDLKQAVANALNQKAEKRYQELERVFGRFGYYYPSSILLGGSPIFKDTQDWIASTRTSQERVQYKSVKPIYELLDDEQRMQVFQLYEENKQAFRDDMEIPKGMHFDGMDAEEQAIELAHDTDFYRNIMCRNLLDRPDIELSKQNVESFDNVVNYVSLDKEVRKSWTGTPGFALGSQAAFKERHNVGGHHDDDTEVIYDLIYVTYKQLYLDRQFIQPTKQFKDAITNALQVGKLDYDTYCALQDVFQRFGYYYPKEVQFGGRIILRAASQEQQNEDLPQIKNIRKRYQGYLQMHEEHSNTQGIARITEASGSEEDNQWEFGSSNAKTTVKNPHKLITQDMTSSIEKSISTSGKWSAIGGQSVCLLWNDIQGWIRTAQANPVVILRRHLRPLYELLNVEEQYKVQLTYENVLSADNRARYNCPLKITLCQVIPDNERENDTETLSNEQEPGQFAMETGSLFEQLTEQTFVTSNSALEFCHSACKQWGFSVTEEIISDTLACVYCAHGRPATNTSSISATKRREANICQWGIALLKNDENQWKFEKLQSEEESVHNHKVKGKTGSVRTGQKRSMRTIPDPSQKNTIIINITPANQMCQPSTGIQHVRYGDIVQLEFINSTEAARASKLNNERQLITMAISAKNYMDTMIVDARIHQILKHFVSVTQCLENTIEGHNRLQYAGLKNELEGSDSEYLWKVKRYALDYEEQDTTHSSYVQTGDIICFESLVPLQGSHRLYLTYAAGKLSCIISNTAMKFESNRSGWQVIRNIDNKIVPIDDPDYLPEELKNEIRATQLENQIDQWEEEGSDVTDDVEQALHTQQDDETYKSTHTSDRADTMEKLNPLKEKKKGNTYVEKAKLLWKTGEYQEALQMYEQAALLSVREAYYELGNLYHSGFTAKDCIIPQNHEVAFAYYLIADTLGNGNAALKLAQYYEKGYSKNVGVDLNKALYWYSLVSASSKFPFARLAVANVKHALARTSTDPFESNKLRQDAFLAFAEIAGCEPYAKFMVAMYHLYGWGIQQPDPAFGFQVLLSLVESGVDGVLPAISRCYNEGIGVERDKEKAQVYQDLATRMGTS
ncbi:hypothetical protein EC973_007851 [Apophysomyces ossiformis]|uniref:MACPF domain-containing protein n=1 Tax=Apophysomyces ossiformis TaxID=679940 RepID=A0A8H7EQP8_9FUNG|nr:hypothetical protein EC973_007851 [Apophysomyces ossiformis]